MIYWRVRPGTSVCTGCSVSSLSGELIVERLEVLARAEVVLEGELERPEDVRMHSCGVDVSQIS